MASVTVRDKSLRMEQTFGLRLQCYSQYLQQRASSLSTWIPPSTSPWPPLRLHVSLESSLGEASSTEVRASGGPAPLKLARDRPAKRQDLHEVCASAAPSAPLKLTRDQPAEHRDLHEVRASADLPAASKLAGDRSTECRDSPDPSNVLPQPQIAGLDLGAADARHGSFNPESSVPALERPSAVSPLFKARSKQVWLKSREAGYEIRRRRRIYICSKDELKNPSWISRKQVIFRILESTEHPVSALSRAQRTLQPFDYELILRRLVTQRRWKQVCQVFGWMKENGKVTSHSLTTFISSMGKAGLPSRALRAFKLHSDPQIRLNHIVCNSLFKALIFNGRVEAAFVLYEQLKSEGFVPVYETYKLLLAGCAKHRGAYPLAERFLQEMLEAGWQPDSYVFTSLLNVCATFGLEEKAHDIIRNMKSAGIALNNYHYVSLLHLYAQLKKPEEAEKLFLDMQRNHVALNKNILSSMLKVYTSSGLLERANEFFNGMEALGFPPQEVSYCLMMDAYVKASNVDEAHRLFEDLKARGIKQGCYAHCILISAYSKLGRADVIELLVQEIYRLPKESLDLPLFNNLLRTYAELGQMDGMCNTLKMMEEENVAPDRATYNILISFFSKEELFDVAKDTLQDLLDRKLRPNLVVILCLLSGNISESFFFLLCAWRFLKRHPSLFQFELTSVFSLQNSFAPLILGLLKAGYMDTACVAYEKMKEVKIPVSATFLENVIELLCETKKIDEALQFLNEMEACNLSPTPMILESLFIAIGGNLDYTGEILKISNRSIIQEVNFDAVLTCYKQQGHHDAIPKFLQCMKEHGFHPQAMETIDTVC